jgi:hypothetical protein
MTTVVSELCETMAAAIPMPLDVVKKYARALIASGDLPKAMGRSIPNTDMHHRAKLILALAASERPADCVKAMRDRYEAVARLKETELTAGEVLAAELRGLASKDVSYYQKWEVSKLEVSRGGTPRVQFRFHENMKHFRDFKDTPQPEFLGGPWLAKDADKLGELLVEYQGSGFPVSALVSGDVLMAAAFGSKEAAQEARSEIIRAYHAQNSKGDGE